MGLTQKLGTIPLAILTDASNNVGIGAAPSGTYKLEVTGTAKVSSTLLVSGASTLTGNVGIGTATPDIFSRGYTGTIVGVSVAAGDTGIEINGGTGSGAYIDLGTGGTRRMGIISTATDSQIISLSTLPLVFKTNSVTALTINSSQAATFSSSVTTGGAITSNSGDIYSTDGTRTNYLGVSTGSNIGILGMTTNHDLRIITNNTEKMRITSGNDVGIGAITITNPNSLSRVLEIKIASSVGIVLNDSRDANPIGLENRGAVFNLTYGTTTLFEADGASKKIKIAGQLGIGRNVVSNYPLSLQAPSSDTLFTGYSSNGTYAMDCYEDSNSGEFHMRNGSRDVYLARTTGTWVGNSDKTIKENITLIDNSLEKLMQLNGYYYNLIDDEDKHKCVGVIAQEVQKVLPEATHISYSKTYDREIMGVEYDVLIPLLINAVKEQQAQIQNLQEQNQDLKSRLDKAGL